MHAASVDDVDRAVKAAKAALVHPSWKNLPGTERGQLMGRLADLMEQNKELFATIDAWDNGMLAVNWLRVGNELTTQANPITSPSTKTSSKPSGRFDTTAAGRIRHSARLSAQRRRNSHILSASLLVWSARSSRGTIPCPWRAGSWDRRLPVGIRWC